MRFEDLEVWKRSARLSADLYRCFQTSKDYGFRDQITRSGLSIPSNIAEGYERATAKDRSKFLTYAKGSCAEPRTQITIGMEVGYKERNPMELEKNTPSYTAMSSKEDVLRYLKDNKRFFQDTFGVTRIGIFGSFAQDRQTGSSDIDMVVEFEKGKKNIHNFFRLKRFLELHLGRKVDLGFEQSLKPIVREKVKGKILYG